MEIKIIRSELLNGLGLMQSVVERRSTMPILANVLLFADEKRLSITATDLEVGINSNHPADVISKGKVAIHARSIYDIVRELPDDKVHITVSEGNWVEMNCGKSKFRIVGLSPDEFPIIPTKGKGDLNRIESGVILDMLEKTSFAMSSDETRHNLNGIYLAQRSTDGGDAIRMVATDGHRLSIVDRAVGSKWNLENGAIVPRKGVIEIKKLAETSDAPIDIWIDVKHLIAYKDNITLVVRLIDGQFPPYEQVVPKKTQRIVSTDRVGLVHAMKRVSVLSTDRMRGVKFAVSPKNIDIFASNPDVGEAHEELSADYRGNAFDIGLNARYLLDALSCIEDEKAVLELGDDTSPCVLRSELDRGFTHIVMPMRL